MLDAILRFSLVNRGATLLIAVLVAAGGYAAFRDLTVEAFPDPTDTQVQVITLFAGQPTEEVERRVSVPLERALNGTPGLVRLRSISIFGLSFVTLTFQDGVDPQLARTQVVERLPNADLPTGVTPDLGPMATPIGEIYRYTLRGPGADPMTLRTLQDWVVRPQILRVGGVADVVSYGGLLHEIHVQPDPVRMAPAGVTLSDIYEALRKASDNATGGTVERGLEQFVIRSLAIFRDLKDIQQVRVGFHGVPVLLKDVAQVTVGHAPRQGVVSRDGDEDAVEGIVLMRRGQNPSVVLADLRARLDELNAHILPDGIRVEAFYDRTELVDTTLRTVFRNLVEGALLVILVLMAFLVSVRASLVVATVIPLSLCASFIFLSWRGMTANLLSMGAVDFGIIVDGAVILVEHILHRVRGGPDLPGDAPLNDRVRGAALEVARPTLFSLLIIIAAYLPIFSLQRVEGRIFSPMAFTVVSALAGAMFMSFTLVPVLMAALLRRSAPPPESPLLRVARTAYRPTLRVFMDNPLAALILSVGLVVGTFELVPRLGSEFLPELNEGALYVTFTLPENMSITSSRRLIPTLKALLARTPEVEGQLSQLGRPEDGTDPTLSNNLEIFVKLKPPHAWRPEMRTLDDIVAELNVNLREVPGIEYNFSQPIRDNVNENISGQFGQVALKIFGDDLDALQDAATIAKDTIAAVPGAADVGVVKSGEVPQIALQLDRQALAHFDLDAADVQDHLETAMAGHVATELWEGERRFDVTVRLPRTTRRDVDAIRRIVIPMRNGSTIPVSAVARVDVALGRAAITRENGRRYVGVRMNVRGRDLGRFVEEARARVDAALHLRAGSEMAWGGEFENKERAMKRLQLVIPLALLLTFLLLYSAFKSMWDASLIMLNVPLALSGGIWGLAAADMPLSVSAAVGFIALLGQAVLNGVLVVASIRARMKDGEPLKDAVQSGTEDRLRAVLVTALLASLGLLPAAFSHAMGSETQRPIAVVVVAGTVTAALLTLGVLPVTYYWATRARDALRARLGLPALPQPA